MSIEAMTWALGVPVGGNQKVMLLGLANHAHPDGSEAYPSLDTLATYGCCNRSTARRNVRSLEDDGWIERDGDGPKGTAKYRLRMGGGNLPPGGAGATGGVAPVQPEPSLEPSVVGVGVGSEQGDGNTSIASNANGVGSATGRIFEHWRAAMSKSAAARLTPERSKVVASRLRTFSEQELRDAITVASRDAWTMGENDRHKPFNDLTVIFRTDTKVSQWLEQAAEPARLSRDPMLDGLLRIARGDE